MRLRVPHSHSFRAVVFRRLFFSGVGFEAAGVSLGSHRGSPRGANSFNLLKERAGPTVQESRSRISDGRELKKKQIRKSKNNYIPPPRGLFPQKSQSPVVHTKKFPQNNPVRASRTKQPI